MNFVGSAAVLAYLKIIWKCIVEYQALSFTLFALKTFLLIMHLKWSRLLMRTICCCLSLIMLTSKSNSLLGIQGFAPYTSSCTYCCIDEHIYSLCKSWWHLHSHLSASSTGEEEHIYGICILISPSSTREEQHMKKEVYPKQIKLPLNKKCSNGQTIIPLQLH